MRIKRVNIENFRGVRKITIDDLRDMVVLAGQNGSGKSCILDAIRLVKSVYGGYQQNEFHQWFGEFQINFSNDPRALQKLFNDPAKRITIELDIEIHDDERRYLKANADALIEIQAWKAIVPELYSWRSLNAAPFTAQYRSREPEVKAQVERDRIIFDGEIDAPFIRARINIYPNSQPNFSISKVLEIVFSTFDLDSFGIIDYHGPHRMYGRETLSSINVNLDAIEEQKKQSALYNYNAKYSNVKSEMAGLYVREALAEKAGIRISIENSTTEVLKELFSTFFPEKEFLGPQPTANGALIFPVKVGGRETHDLDELSSGEKEILYGYLRIRTSAPKNSVILLDEPELHLNPRLIKNLPDFYYRRLAKSFGNQVWLITHSDTILRESVGRPEISVFHITPSAYAERRQSQATPIEADHDLESAIIDLVGDLASYTPGGQIVIFEGGESDFDLRMTSELFPEITNRTNLISGTNRSRVRGIHDILEQISRSGRAILPRICSVVDRDSDPSGLPLGPNRFQWDRYHIENYLLEAKFIGKALHDVSLPTIGSQEFSLEWIEEQLRSCAAETIQGLVAHTVQNEINSKLVSAIGLNYYIGSSSGLASEITRAINKSRERFEEITRKDISEESIKAKCEELESGFMSNIENNIWIERFRGRDVLKKFVGRHGQGIKYKHFRNLILSKMRDAGYRPPGMAKVVDQIVKKQTFSYRFEGQSSQSA